MTLFTNRSPLFEENLPLQNLMSNDTPSPDSEPPMPEGESLHDSEVMLRAILESAVDPIVTINHHGIIRSCNPATQNLLGYTPVEIIGRNVALLMPASIGKDHDRYIANYLSTGKRQIIGVGREVTARHKDGTLVPVHLAVSEVVLQGRRLFTGILRDISDRKKAEEQAIQAERLAAVGQVVTTISHESRNLLQRIQMGVELLQHQLADNPAALAEVEGIELANDGLSKLLDEIRTFTAPIRLETEPFDLRAAWRDAWSRATQAGNYPSAALVELGDNQELTFHGDRSRMVQVFRNLFENSLVAGGESPQSQIHGVFSDVGGHPRVQVTVSDNGPGMNEEQRRKAFEPFYSTKSKGTGLGLAIVRRIVEAHGGQIRLADQVERGARFVIEVPL